MRLLQRVLIAAVAAVTAGGLTLTAATASAEQIPEPTGGFSSVDVPNQKPVLPAQVKPSTRSTSEGSGSYKAPTQMTFQNTTFVVKKLKKSKCQDIPVAYKHNGKNIDYTLASFDQYQNGKYLTPSWAYTMFAEPKGEIDWRWCVKDHEIGKHKWVPTAPGTWQKFVYDAETDEPQAVYGDNGDFVWWAIENWGEFENSKSWTITVKQGVKIAKPKIKKTGLTRKITSKATFFDVKANKWKPNKKSTLTLQFRDAKGKKKWKKVKTVKTDSKGKVSVKVTAKQKNQYRFVYKGTTKLEAKNSKVTKK